ncbi:MAG TPA: FAD-dependent oxidoreductase [Stellaceae bacterium]|nr:FAD-dependent oxidoreductase [Stellaceae bacterium]
MSDSASREMTSRCCVVGGGPAGMMLGLLLGRAGIDTVVLEKHADFLRDFRGDTIHPSTLEVLAELGLLEALLQRPHDELREIVGQIGEERLVIGDFSHLPTRCKFIALMPQWHFLDFLAEAAEPLPSFRLLRETAAERLVVEDGRIAGVVARDKAGALTLRADLVIGCDGRHSTVRREAGLSSRDLGAPIDVLWLGLSKRPGDPGQTLGRFDDGRILVMIDRGDYWQCAFVIPKGGFAALQASGLAHFHAELAALMPPLADRLSEIRSWDDVKLLTVAVDRLERWHRPGLLCIGDAAHAMSPIGGIGINLAIQDAVAAANILVPWLRRAPGPVAEAPLAAIERRRLLPTRLTQAMQVLIQNRVIRRVLGTRGTLHAPAALRLLRRFPVLRRIPARLVGIGFRPEHVRI